NTGNPCGKHPVSPPPTLLPSAAMEPSNVLALSRGGYSPCSPYSLLRRCVRLRVAPFPLRALDMRCARCSSKGVGSGGMSDIPVPPGECKRQHRQAHVPGKPYHLTPPQGIEDHATGDTHPSALTCTRSHRANPQTSFAGWTDTAGNEQCSSRPIS